MHEAGALLAGRYRLAELLGAGGMGEVWRASDELLGRPVAVKVMRPELLTDLGVVRRFRAEARAMAIIDHPGIVGVYDFVDDASSALLVMAYVAGEPLSAMLSRERLSPGRTMRLVAQAADALQAAHERGVIHRDVKPSNILVRPGGAVALTDFGIAWIRDATALTADGQVLGTPSYLAPEQVRGGPALPQSDVYALGVVAYECLTGCRPFDRANPWATAIARLNEPPPTLSGVPPAVVAVLDRALAPEPGNRWPSAGALAAACRHADPAAAVSAAAPVATYLPPLPSSAVAVPVDRATARPTSRKMAKLVVVTVLISALAVVAVLVNANWPDPPPPDLIEFSPFTGAEQRWLFEDGGHRAERVYDGFIRFTDLYEYVIYRFDVPNGIAARALEIEVAHEFLVQVSTDGEQWVTVLEETGKANPCYQQNREVRQVDLGGLDGTAELLYLKFSDSHPDDGCGAWIARIWLR